MKWSVLETIKLVELYREHECLWNTTCADYTMKFKRDAAYEEIVREMRMENFGVAELKQKIKNLRSTYNQECKKIQKSNKCVSENKDTYVPNLKWFTLMDSFLRNMKGDCETEDSLTKVCIQEETCFIKEEFEEEESALSPLTPSTSQSSEDHATPRLMAISEEPPPKKTKYTKRKEQRMVHEELRIENAETNENIAFGKYVGLALDKMPLQQSIMARDEIQTILTKYRLSSYTSPGP